MKFNEAKKILTHQIAFELAIKSLKTEVGDIAVKHFKKSFDMEGFNDVPFKRWKPLKRERSRYANRKILTQTGTLKRSLRYNSYVGSKIWWVNVSSPLIYANVHNEGLMAGRGAGFKMPKRQFMGDSKLLDKKIQRRIETRINQAFK